MPAMMLATSRNMLQGSAVSTGTAQATASPVAPVVRNLSLTLRDLDVSFRQDEFATLQVVRGLECLHQVLVLGHNTLGRSHHPTVACHHPARPPRTHALATHLRHVLEHRWDLENLIQILFQPLPIRHGLVLVAGDFESLPSATQADDGHIGESDLCHWLTNTRTHGFRPHADTSECVQAKQKCAQFRRRARTCSAGLLLCNMS